ncbi:MAG: YuzL family protein [Bacillaceae bacterium]
MVKRKKNPSKGAVSAADVKGNGGPHDIPNTKGRHGNNQQYPK